MLLLLRLIPYLVGLAEGALFFWQRRIPETYPWMVVTAVCLLPLAALMISWKRMEWRDVVEKMAPTVFFQASLAFGLLLVETPLALWAVILFAGFSALLSLELLFLNCFEPSAYPVSGLSRLNIAFVPLISWYVVATSTGLMTFLNVSHSVHLVLCTVLGLVLFRTTGHPGATAQQNRIWMMVGALVGLEVGWLGLHLPLSMPMQGVVAAVIITGMLRVRRYVYDPRPSLRVAWSEVVMVFVLFVASLSTAKWL